MSRTVWKYPLVLKGVQVHHIPRGAEVLTVQVQEDRPYLWARVDPDAMLERREFLLCGTGNDAPENARYIATFQTPPFVWHVWEPVEMTSE